VLQEANIAGVYIDDTIYDDVDGSGCGCGRMPWLRAIGEILKGGDCIVKPCF